MVPNIVERQYNLLQTLDIPFYNFVIMHKIQNHVGIEGIQVTES